MNPNYQMNQQRNQQQQQQQQQQIENYSQDGGSLYSEQQENGDQSEEQGQQDQGNFVQQNVAPPPLTEQQLKEEISLFFNIFVNPPLIFGCLTAIAFENNQIIYQNQNIQQAFTYSSLLFYSVMSLCYCFQFFKALRYSKFNWKQLRFINYFGFFSISLLMIIFIINGILQKRYFDLRWSRMAVTLLMLSQYVHFTIKRFYGEFDITLPAVFNRIYFLVIPLNDHEKENAFVSLTEIYVKLKQCCQPLTLIYFLIQIVYHMKMYKWAPPFQQLSPPSLDVEYGHEQYLWIAIDQQRTLQMFSLFIILALLTLGCSPYFGISHEHQSRLPYIFIFLHYTTYIMTYKFYLTGQLLTGDSTNIEKILTPIIIITIIPLFCTLFIKRALTKLYRLPSTDQQQMQQHQIELFSQYKLDFPRNYPDPPEYVSSIQQKQQQTYQLVTAEQIGICFVLFIYQFVNLNQLYSTHQQETIGPQIQGFYDLMVDINVYIFIIHTFIYQVLTQTAENILNQTEYGIFSFLFLANYVLTLQWTLICFLTLIILTSYIMNFTEQDTVFHIGPAISILWMLLIYSIKQGAVPKMIYEYAKFVKIQFFQGQLLQRLDIHNNIMENLNNMNANNQQNQQQNINSNSNLIINLINNNNNNNNNNNVNIVFL
ncbi:transmembrane protein, putative (macronuclear) [Tetrahymena thermophila SB210]|uniref:Transmembrane protein, putative n=1 Tax=Tetrahymena thermophila (strain SB210) TaxID=312017 RepID=Q23JB4_TETTS|nr:transmembrane protein, putative [Tetrahymena thermophila SB210]EAR96590.2 transmembrane protein, putative [Tetrahymena thermophila SB210]|eukprot:XP_001016835.2 transmembrane protein, putative [Tetrahymena thermophila SB210]